MLRRLRWLARAVAVGVGVLLVSGLAAQQRGTAIAEVTAVHSGAHHVLIEWTTLGEQDTDYFAVERSEDGERFEEIGRLTGQGRTEFRHDYNFFDYRSDVSETRYYRVREMTFGGQEGRTRVYVVPGLRVATLPSLALTGSVERRSTDAPFPHE